MIEREEKKLQDKKKPSKSEELQKAQNMVRFLKMREILSHLDKLSLLPMGVQ